MLLGIFILLVIIGVFIKPKLKIWQYVPLIFLCIVKYYGHNVVDFANYEAVYSAIKNGWLYIDTGIGWYYLCKVGILAGLDYKTFNIILFAICVLLMDSTVRLYVKNYRNRIMIWSLFLLFPSLLDAVQMRFFVAESLFIFALRFLPRRNTKSYIIYTVLCLLATTVHTSAIFYLLFLLGPVLHRIQKYLAGLVLATTAFMVFGRGLIYQLASRIVNIGRMDRYFNSTDSIGPFGLVAYTATLFLFWQVARYFVGKTKSKKKHTDSKSVVPTVRTELSDLFYQISVLMWMVIPLTLFDTNFFRIQRPMWLLLYIVCVMMMEKGQKSIKFGRIPAIRTRYFVFGAATMGFVFYIAIFSMDVIQSFLL